LEKLMSGRTTFVIAHRLSTVQFANRIIVLNKGRIVEEGTHKELIDKNGSYKRFYDMQMGKFAQTLPNVFGFLDMNKIKINYGIVNTMYGWAIADDNSEIASVRILSGGTVVGEGNVGMERPDIYKAYLNFSNSLKSGFKIELRVNENPLQEYSVVITDKKGRTIKETVFKLSDFDANSYLSL
jgi:ABC-type multidrug transport system ATPase subunit